MSDDAHKQEWGSLAQSQCKLRSLDSANNIHAQGTETQERFKLACRKIKCYLVVSGHRENRRAALSMKFSR